MDFEIENELRPNLSSGERLLWAGRPKTGFLLRPSDRYMIPFSLFWAGFAFFWEFMAIQMKAPFPFKMFGLPFILIGLYIVAGRFFVDLYKRKSTRYGITTNRVVIQTGAKRKKIISINLRTLSEMSFTEKADGSGTILLGREQPSNSTSSNSNRLSLGRTVPALEFIPDVKRVYGILVKLQSAG